jgi:hypothetical protein
VHITTRAPRIFVTTTRSSVLGYEFKEVLALGSQTPSLEQLFTDDISRKGITHIVVELEQPATSSPQQSFDTVSQSQRAKDDSIVNILLGSDKDGQIFGLEVPRYRTYQSAAPTIFELQAPQCVTKFSRGAVRAPWYERRKLVTGVLTDDIFGAATDGTIYHFTLLSEVASLLLKFLENLVRWDEIENQISMLRLEQQSVLGNDHSVIENEKIDWPVQNIVIDPEFMPGAAGHRVRRDQYGINGELLEPFLLRNGDARLMSMLSRDEHETRDEESRYVGNHQEMRWRKFCELVGRGLGANTNPTPHNEQHAAVSKCVTWLREVMRPVL